MELRIRVYPLFNECENAAAFRFLKEAIADMFSKGISNCDTVEMILGWENSYLLSCTNEADEVCGVFEVHLPIWRDDCFVNIAYTHADYRQQGVFKALFAFTNDTLPSIIGLDFGTISFGVFDSNRPMRSVMRKSGCLPVDLYEDVEATVWSFPRNAAAAEELQRAAAMLEANPAHAPLSV